MSALAEALVAAQRRALTALEKQYVAGRIDSAEDFAKDTVRSLLYDIGLTDDVDIDRLLAALDVIRTYGSALPAEPTNGATEKPPELASQKQRDWIADLFAKSNHAPLDPNDVARLTKAQASKLIDSLQAGSYESAEWDVPF